jgi:RHH-type rel operon transcriptional repressor/antitoxin RelB
MTTMTLRIDDDDAEIVRRYARFEGKSISEFIREAVFEKIEDEQDLSELREAIAADDGERYTQDEVLGELGL